MAVTGYPDWAIKDDKRHVHFTEVLAKPIDATDLFSRVDRLLVERELSTA